MRGVGTAPLVRHEALAPTPEGLRVAASGLASLRKGKGGVAMWPARVELEESRR